MKFMPRICLSHLVCHGQLHERKPLERYNLEKFDIIYSKGNCSLKKNNYGPVFMVRNGEKDCT